MTLPPPLARPSPHAFPSPVQSHGVSSSLDFHPQRQPLQWEMTIMLDYHGPICPDLLMRRLREEGPWEATAPDSTILFPRPPVPANPPPPQSLSLLQYVVSATITPRIITPAALRPDEGIAKMNLPLTGLLAPPVRSCSCRAAYLRPASRCPSRARLSLFVVCVRSSHDSMWD